MATVNYQFSNRAFRWLREAGWHPGRRVDVDYSEVLGAKGWLVVPPAAEFLRQFGELDLRSRPFGLFGFGFGGRRTRLRFGAVPVRRYHDEPFAGTVEELTDLQPCTPIGEFPEASEVYVMDGAGKVYGWLPWDVPLVPPLWLAAHSPEELV